MNPTALGIAIGIPIGLFLAVVLYAWLDEREDPYAGINIPEKKVTSIEWSLRKQTIPPKYPILPKKNRNRGHLGYLDHRAKERCKRWIISLSSQQEKW